jgi:hypothetical protein
MEGPMAGEEIEVGGTAFPGDEPIIWNDESQGVDIDLTGPAASEFNAEGVHVSVAEGVTLRGRYLAVQKMGQQVVDHLSQRGQYGGQPRSIKIQFVRVVNTTKKPVEIEVASSGTLGGKSFEFTSRAYRLQSKPGLTGSSQLLRLVANAISSAKTPAKVPLQLCSEQCTADICVQLDQIAGHEETLTSFVYRVLDLSQWILAVLAAGYIGWKWHAAHPEDGLSTTLCLAGMGGLSALFFVQGLGRFLTPRSFFYETPRGKREGARLGIESFLAFRLKNLFLAVAAAAVGMGLLLVTH